MKSLRLLTSSLCLLAVVALTGAAAAQAPSLCTPVPNTGCPGALPPDCTGSTQLGSQLTITPINSGRAPFTYVLVGPCEAAPVAFPSVFLCVPGPCNLGVTLGLAIAVPTAFVPLALPIPSAPALAGVTLCTQCVDVVLGQSCLTLSQAASFTLTL